MIRKHVVEALQRVAPALSSADLVPILSHFCFDGRHVFAFNEQIGISCPLKTEFKGAIPGRPLLQLLTASRAKEVEFNVTNDAVTVKASSSRLKLPLLSAERFVWTPPKVSETGGKNILDISARDMLRAMSNCMRSVSMDTTVPDYLGVTAIMGDKKLMLFASDNSTLSYAEVPIKKPPKFDRVILSGLFCKELLSVADPAKALHLEVHKDHALAASADGSVLFGKLIYAEKPINFENKIARHFGEDVRKALVSIPTKLELVLERACIASGVDGEPVTTAIMVSDGVAHFHTQARMAEVKDSVQLEPKQKNVTITINPRLLKAGYGSFTQMCIKDNAFIMTDGKATYMVATA